jgi:hypothetical protein
MVQTIVHNWLKRGTSIEFELVIVLSGQYPNHKMISLRNRELTSLKDINKQNDPISKQTMKQPK